MEAEWKYLALLGRVQLQKMGKCVTGVGAVWVSVGGRAHRGRDEGRATGGEGTKKGRQKGRRVCIWTWAALPFSSAPLTPAVTPRRSPPRDCSVRPIHSPTRLQRSPPDRSYTPGLHPAGHRGQGASRQHPLPPTFFRTPETAVLRSGQGLSPWTASPPECSFLAQCLTEAGVGGVHTNTQNSGCVLSHH